MKISQPIHSDRLGYKQLVVSDLASMTRQDLEALWAQLMAALRPKGISHTMMRRILAFELQAKNTKDSPAINKALRTKLARAVSEKARKKTPSLKVGSRLVREWNGRTEHVDVVEGGFLWCGETYRSLSKVAKAITGAHWSGPRFFGIQKIAGPEMRAEEAA